MLAQPTESSTDDKLTGDQSAADEAAAAGAPAENGGAGGTPPSGRDDRALPAPAAAAPAKAFDGEQAPTAPGSVVVGAGNIPVPNLVGQTVRAATENAGRLALGLQVLGSGIARAQSPAPGTRVPAGTQIVVRFTR